jgi:transcriptional regulator with XRE-family HTH domain
MGFSDNLKMIRKERSITQEQLAELLNVSRQAISKWESGIGYPETEKLLILAKELNVSLDYLLLDAQPDHAEKMSKEQKAAVYVPSGKIAISTYNGDSVVICHAVKASKILAPGKNEPRYILLGIDKVTFWGEHSSILGWYEAKDAIEQEISEITQAIHKGEGSYTLKYYAQVEFVGLFGQPRLKK